MFPSKSMVEYIGDTSRIFPTIRLDSDTSNTYVSPFQTPTANRYSSSTDSTTPESINTPFQINHPEFNRPTSESPKAFESLVYDPQNISPMFYDSPKYALESPTSNDSPKYALESPTSNLNRNPHNLPTFERNLTGFEPKYYDNINTSFDRNFPIFKSQYNDQIQISDTPLQLRHQRGIVGRKILGCHSKATIDEAFKSETNFECNLWQPMTPHVTEPTQKRYELFPSNEKSYEFRTPQKSKDNSMNYACMSPSSSIASSSFLSQSPNKLQNLSPNCSNRLQTLSPNYSNMIQNLSPSYSNRIQNLSPNCSNRIQNLSPNRLNTIQTLSPNCANKNFGPENLVQSPNKLPYPEFRLPYNPSFTGAASSKDSIGPSKMCMFCRKNGEMPSVYMNHGLKEKNGNKYRVTCPILRALVCMTCGASGDDAHTITYCPVLRSNNDGKPLPSTTITLKTTRIKSNGRKRY